MRPNKTMNLPVGLVTVRACARPAPIPPAGYNQRYPAGVEPITNFLNT